MKSRFLGVAFGAALMAFAVQSVEAKTLVFCSEGSPEGFNASLYTSSTTFDASSRAVFDGLVKFKRGTTEIIPGLAEKWEVSDDGKTYTFHLRKGVKFHSAKHFKPTRDFNADDVLHTFNRMWKTDNPYHMVSGGTYVYFNSMGMPDVLESIKKVDDYTVVFKLKHPEAPIIANLGMDFAVIRSAEYADAMAKAGTKEKVDQWPIGTGPFVFKGYQKDALIRYTANKDYWRGKAPIDKLVFAITKDPAVRYAKLKKGECHVMPYPNPADLAAMAKDKDINLLSQEGLNVGFLAYNTQKAPFNNRNVRKALNMAINKNAIIEAVFQGAGKVAKNPLPPTIWSYNKATKDDPYNPTLAKKMLDEAGVKNLETSIWAMPVQRPYNPNARRMAEMIQEDWSKVGVKANIVSYEWGEYLKRSKDVNREGAVLMGWTGDNGDPDNFLSVKLGCEAVGRSNRAQWCYKPFEDLIQKAKITASKAERTKLYEKAQLIFKEQAPWATIAHSMVFEPVRKNVKNYKIDPLGAHMFYGVDLD